MPLFSIIFMDWIWPYYAKRPCKVPSVQSSGICLTNKLFPYLRSYLSEICMPSTTCCLLVVEANSPGSLYGFATIFSPSCGPFFNALSADSKFSKVMKPQPFDTCLGPSREICKLWILPCFSKIVWSSLYFIVNGIFDTYIVWSFFFDLAFGPRSFSARHSLPSISKYLIFSHISLNSSYEEAWISILAVQNCL